VRTRRPPRAIDDRDAASLIAVVAALRSRDRATQIPRDIEDRLPIVDANGGRMTLIRTRNLSVVLRSAV
jgi:hypothetical protein